MDRLDLVLNRLEMPSTLAERRNDWFEPMLPQMDSEHRELSLGAPDGQGGAEEENARGQVGQAYRCVAGGSSNALGRIIPSRIHGSA